MSATPAATAISADVASKVSQSGTGSENGPAVSSPTVCEQHVQREPDSEVGDDADDRRRHRRERACKPADVAHRLDIGRAGEDPKEARHESEPDRRQAAGDVARGRIEP
jgi:hypothetical protein